MNFDELLEEVFLITNRRDLVAETESAVKQATLKAHKTDYYSKDIFESGVDLKSLDFRHSLDYISLFSNFRTLKYFKRVEDENDDVGKLFDIITPEEVIDEYERNRTDILYVAGRVLEIRSSVEFQFALLGAYVYPVVREGAYNSWVAEQYPFAIIHEAARRILLSIGDRDESNGQRDLLAEEYAELKLSAVTDTGS